MSQGPCIAERRHVTGHGLRTFVRKVRNFEAHENLPSLMLYVRRNAGGISCQYCIDVLLVVEELGLRVNEKNINDVQHENELRKLGGKVQVPYLIDKTSNIAMYESIDIINHLRRTYPKKTK